MLMPFLWMLLTSLMSQKQIFSYPPELIPNPLHVQNYSEVAKSIPVATYFINSAVVAVITTIGQLVIASMAGYAFARLVFKYREQLFLLFLATTMIPPQVNIVPLFFIMRELGWIDTYQALIVPDYLADLAFSL
jgi:multiple sugar transport system permease protein